MCSYAKENTLESGPSFLGLHHGLPGLHAHIGSLVARVWLALALALVAKRIEVFFLPFGDTCAVHLAVKEHFEPAAKTTSALERSSLNS